MNFYKYFDRLKNESLSIMIIPHSGDNIKQVKFKKSILYYIIAIAITSTILFSISFVFLISNYTHTNKQMQEKDKYISHLEQIKIKQSGQINELQTKTQLITEKLNMLTELETKVRNLVGLKKNNDSTQIKKVSRSNTYPKKSDANLLELTSKINNKTDTLKTLIGDVNSQLNYLNAIPNRHPTIGKVTSKFGYRVSPISNIRKFHKGLDISNKTGTQIVAAGTGIVTFCGWHSGYGKTIVLSHGYGYRSVYAHNSKNLVKVGQKVNKGDIIAKIGSTGRSTGPHLHFEVHFKGQAIDPQTILK
ncbi:M23 family metallopeptidase [Lutibacter sp. B2]|nr:M23 family metallopeptidase [Lutibacter sp. B2]